MTDQVSAYRVDNGVAVLTINSPPVNALGHTVRIALCEGVDRALADNAARAVVLICAGRTFFAGADVTEIGKPILPPLLGDVMARFESSTKPIVSAMHGTALGGGLELALAGHYRVAVPSAVVGLPEVALGLLPGAGGTQRVPRLIGVAAAVEMIGLGRHVKASEALEIGLIDAVVPEGELEGEAIAFAQDVVRNGAPLRRLRDLAPDLGLDEAHPVFDRFRAAHPELFVGVKAVDGVMRAIEAAITLPFDEGLERERAISRELIATPESAAQRHLFFAERAATKLPGSEKEKPAASACEIVETGSDLVAYNAAIAVACDSSVVVGRSMTHGVAEIVVGTDTASSAALAAMDAARKSGVPAIFVTPQDGLVLGRLRAAFEAGIAALKAKGVLAGDIAASGRAFGFQDALLPSGQGTASDAVERQLLAPALAEAKALVAEGVAKRGSDIDFAMVRAGLWPLWRGGPAFMADRAAAVDAEPVPA